MKTNNVEKILNIKRLEKERLPEEALSINCLQEVYPRQYDILKKMNIQTIDTLLKMTTFELIEHPAFKNQDPESLIRAVHLLGYSFKDEQLTEAAAKVRTRKIA